MNDLDGVTSTSWEKSTHDSINTFHFVVNQKSNLTQPSAAFSIL